MKRILLPGVIVLALVIGVYFMTQKGEDKVADVACGKVTIAEMNWASAELMANVDKAMLEAMGCEVELVAGSTMPTFTSMNETGQPDVAPEIWANAMADLVDSAVGAGRL